MFRGFPYYIVVDVVVDVVVDELVVVDVDDDDVDVDVVVVVDDDVDVYAFPLHSVPSYIIRYPVEELKYLSPSLGFVG